jgi:hypothetical protein
LIDKLLDDIRLAAAETKSLGDVVSHIYRLDSGDAQSAAVYLKERGLLGHADRLTRYVESLRQKADEAFRLLFVVKPTPDDRKQERRCLGPLHSDAHRLLQFLNELRSLVDEDDDSASCDTECAPAAGGEATPREVDYEFAKFSGTLRHCLTVAKMLVQDSCDLMVIRDEQWPLDPRISPEAAEAVILSLQELNHNLKLLVVDKKMESNLRALTRVVRSQVNRDEYSFNSWDEFDRNFARDFCDTWHEACHRFVRDI